MVNSWDLRMASPRGLRCDSCSASSAVSVAKKWRKDREWGILAANSDVESVALQKSMVKLLAQAMLEIRCYKN